MQNPNLLEKLKKYGLPAGQVKPNDQLYTGKCIVHPESYVITVCNIQKRTNQSLKVEKFEIEDTNHVMGKRYIDMIHAFVKGEQISGKVASFEFCFDTMGTFWITGVELEM